MFTRVDNRMPRPEMNGIRVEDKKYEAINNFQFIGNRCKGIQRIEHVVMTIKRKIGITL